MEVDNKRIYNVNNNTYEKGAVVYWMSRDQRMQDNWALIFAQELAGKQPLYVIFNLVNKFSLATLRQYDFMLQGLQELEKKLAAKNIPLFILFGKPEENIPKFVKKKQCGALVIDFDPLKIKRVWKNKVKKKINIPFYEVDTHNIVPCRIASDKQEYAAYTIRPKINKKLSHFLVDFPKIRKMSPTKKGGNNWNKLYSNLDINRSVKPVEWLKPGSDAALDKIENFINNKLEKYTQFSNDPNKNMVSSISPYLHFGQISAQKIALMIKQSSVSKEAKKNFLEELIVRKELSDNYCFYNENYDSIKGFPNWAQKTIAEHKHDKREYVYTKSEFENAQTHDELWNAAQIEMVEKGKMHGYMRMYWAKKILEWSESVEVAFNTALYLNDKYELDGRDPNGYVGIAWSMGGVHDRAWQERKIFGKTRYMSYNGCKRKFDVGKFIEKYKNNKNY